MPILTEEERVGTLLAGRYRLDSILGRGGTGVVFEATHNWTGRHVAVKLLRPEHSRDLSLTRRFLQEARAAANIVHPNVVQVLDMGNEPDGTVHLVLELLEGVSLGKHLEDEGTLSVAETLSVLVPIMDALVVAHRQGIIHRDLKPDNVFLHRDGAGRRVPKLLDFGTAKMVDAAWGSATQTGTLVGTPFYMSPEQAEGKKEQGPPTDVWSMGVMLYRCASGTLPFWADTPTKLLIEIIRAEHEKLEERAPDVPLAFASVVDRALEPDVEKRWPTMQAMLDALREAAEDANIPFPALPDPDARVERAAFDPGPSAASRSGRARTAMWAGGALAIALTGAGLASLGGAEPPRRAGDDERVDAASAPTDATRPAAGGVDSTLLTTDAERVDAASEPFTVGAVDVVAAEPPSIEPEGLAAPRPPDHRPVPATGGTSMSRPTSGMQLPGVTREW